MFNKLFLKQKNLVLFTITFFSLLKYGLGTLTCPSGYDLISKATVQLYSFEICDQVTSSVKYRISDFGSVTCTGTVPTFTDDDYSVNVKAICWKSQTPTVKTIRLIERTTCPASYELAPHADYVESETVLCSLMAGGYHTRLSNTATAAIHKSGGGGCTYVSFGGIVKYCLCKATVNIFVQQIETGEIPCSSPCTLCSGIATNCTACSGTTPLLFNNYCYDLCPPTSYKVNAQTCSSKDLFIS